MLRQHQNSANAQGMNFYNYSQSELFFTMFHTLETLISHIIFNLIPLYVFVYIQLDM